VVSEYRFNVRFVVKANGNCPSKEFYDGIDEKKVKAKFIAIWNTIRNSNDGLLRDTEKLEKLHGDRAYGLWEMKARHKNVWYRIFCFRDGPDWMLTHGYMKESNKTDPNEIDKGVVIKKEYEEAKRNAARRR
jgi:phage-related protein